MTTTSTRVGARRLARSTSGLGLSLALAVGLGMLPAASTTTAAAPAAPVLTAPALSLVDHSSAQPMVKQGSRGPAVATLQRHLGIGADGIFGSGTAAAVRSFQSGRGLAADGVVGSRTWAALSGGAPAAAPAAAPASTGGTPTLRQGSRGAAVTELQQLLGIGADGVFGSGTRGAVVNFQRSAGLGADGVVGSRTWGALRGGARPAPVTASRDTARTAPPASSSFGDRAIAEARQHVGKPYVYGASGPNSFDCSGYVQYVMKQLGVSLPHNAAAIYNSIPHIAVSELRRGDLAFVKTDGRITHVGIYDSDGHWYVARRSGTTITRQKIWSTNLLAGRVS